MTSLKYAGLGLIAGFIIHNGDHARRGLDATSEGVVWGGFFGLLVAAVMLTLVFTDHPLAPAAAAVGGLSLAIGVSAVHLLPSWGALSDSLTGGDNDAYTWVAVLAEIAGAAWVGVVGLQQFKANNYQVPAQELAQ